MDRMRNLWKKGKNFAFLQMAILIYSFSMLAAKAAGREKMFSVPFLLLYALMLFCLLVYAICWQPLLKRFSLSTAFCCKAMSVVWVSLGGILLFDEKLTVKKLIGLFFVVLGIILVVTKQRREGENE